MLKPNDLHGSILKQTHLHGSVLKQKAFVPCYVSLNESVLADGPWGKPVVGPKAQQPAGEAKLWCKKGREKPELFARQSLFSPTQEWK